MSEVLDRVLAEIDKDVETEADAALVQRMKDIYESIEETTGENRSLVIEQAAANLVHGVENIIGLLGEPNAGEATIVGALLMARALAASIGFTIEVDREKAGYEATSTRTSDRLLRELKEVTADSIVQLREKALAHATPEELTTIGINADGAPVSSGVVDIEAPHFGQYL